MLLTHLSLTNFRSFARLDLDVPGGPVLLVGGNAQGKTSLLEAVYYLATFTSFHAGADRQLVSFQVEHEPLAVTRIVADFRRSLGEIGPGTSHRMEVRLILDAASGLPRLRKEVIVDGVPRKVGEAMGVFNAVLFLPHMLRIVEGAPDERRRYLNLALGQVWPRYAADLAEYTRILTQRNALLKTLAERGGDPAQLDYWDDQVAQLGGGLIHARIQAVQEIERIARPIHHQLTRGQEVLRLDYQPAFDPFPTSPLQLGLPLKTSLDRQGLSQDKIGKGFREALARARREDIARGTTSLGPHRDELRFFSNGIDLGIYGSRGQGRTAVLALKLGEVAWMKEKTGHWPVLLLDEVLAELDPARRVDLLARLLESEQAMLTTTDLDLYSSEYVHRSTVWQVQSGQVGSGPVTPGPVTPGPANP
ncbi:MAG: DNA replication/repair protein RecF [Chloroflexota bacterium]